MPCRVSHSVRHAFFHRVSLAARLARELRVLPEHERHTYRLRSYTKNRHALTQRFSMMVRHARSVFSILFAATARFHSTGRSKSSARLRSPGLCRSTAKARHASRSRVTGNGRHASSSRITATCYGTLPMRGSLRNNGALLHNGSLRILGDA